MFILCFCVGVGDCADQRRLLSCAGLTGVINIIYLFIFLSVFWVRISSKQVIEDILYVFIYMFKEIFLFLRFFVSTVHSKY